MAENDAGLPRLLAITIGIRQVIDTLPNINRYRAMKKNLGPIDKGLRIGAALIIAALYTLGVIDGVLAIILGIVAVGLVVTSAVSFCPAYMLFNFSTREGGPT